MKINSKVRTLYQELYDLHQLVENRVKNIFEAKKRKQWFFIHRIKGEESFALKLETGRVKNAREMEDFFACTLVVENRSSISEALSVVNEVCDIHDRRPRDDGKTHKSPDEFCFDDLRLYVTLKADDRLPPNYLNAIVFEVQIKTFLQHAWGIATHDLVYKGQNVNWGKARVAYQIKAMLEHAEVTVERVDAIAQSSLLSVTDEKLSKLKSVIDWLKITWNDEQLPQDMVRLGDNILNLAKSINVELHEIIECIRLENEAGRGSLLNDLTPYAAILRSLYFHHRDKLEKFLRTEKGRFRIFLGDDSEFNTKITSIEGVRRDKLLKIEDSQHK